jgi:Alpha/beta hydrolase
MAPLVSSRPAALDHFTVVSRANRISWPNIRATLVDASRFAVSRCVEPAVVRCESELWQMDGLARSAESLEQFVSETAQAFRAADMNERLGAWTQLADINYRAAVAAGKWVPPQRPGWTTLRFDTADRGRLVEAIGDIATATHIVVMVPGMTNELANVERDFRPRSELLYTELLAHAKPGETVAVLMWLGYRNPQISDAYLAVGSDMARTGAELLTADVAALRKNSTAQITVVAHSYGTIVAGEAMKRGVDGGLPVNRVVVVGSPGMNASSRSELGSPKVDLYASSVGENPSPIVGLVRAAGHVLLKTNPATFLTAPVASAFVDTATGRDWAASTTNVQIHGSDPARPSFGSTVFASDGLGHSAYFAPHSLGLTNIALVSLGREPVKTGADAPQKNRRVVTGPVSEPQ